MKVIFLRLLVFWIIISVISCQQNQNFGFYSGVQFDPQNSYRSQQQQYIPPGSNRGYGYGGYPSAYGPYSSSYGPNSYLNSNYGNTQQPNFGAMLGDVSVAILRSLGEMFMGDPGTNQYPYGSPPLPPINNRGQNQFGYGVNAGVYAGTYGNNQGPYGTRNSHIGSTYSGLSGWPVLPWLPPFNPPTTTPSPPLSASSLSSTTTTTTTVPSVIVTTNIQDLPLASVVELPLLETLES